ncbi:MAG: zinc ribbon domain-containing protein [Phycisphaerales bacterium]|nr:MAG: zinc ribbon domain-containing protein [Phycisphaerales bacterium]
MSENPLKKLADAVKKVDAPASTLSPATITGTCPNCEEDVEIMPPERGFDFTAIVQCDHCGRHASLRAFKTMRRRKQAEEAGERQRLEAVAERRAREASTARERPGATNAPAGEAQSSPDATAVSAAGAVDGSSAGGEAGHLAAEEETRAAGSPAACGDDELLPRPRLIRCPACGRKCSDGARVCMRCGHRLAPREHGDRPAPARIEGSVGRINGLATVLKISSLVVMAGAVMAAPFTLGMSLLFLAYGVGGLVVAALLRALAGIWSACEFTADERWRDR